MTKEKGSVLVYWLGLIILALSSLVLFAVIWFNAVGLDSYKPSIEFQVPYIVGAVVFFIIGVYMMRSQREKK